MSDDAIRNLSPEVIAERIKGTLVEAMGIEIGALDDGALNSTMTVRPDHLAPNGYLHAASVVALADTTAGFATYAHLPDGAEGFTTIELKSNFLGTATEGQLHCRATPQHTGRSTQVWDAEVTHPASGRTIAQFRCTQMILWPK
ncbi:MAG: PaaI family thioesterase [Magnetovibrio sp.]|nr:PaaI family thioesterase [Magnetovibrio sp.]